KDVTQGHQRCNESSRGNTGLGVDENIQVSHKLSEPIIQPGVSFHFIGTLPGSKHDGLNVVAIDFRNIAPAIRTSVFTASFGGIDLVQIYRSQLHKELRPKTHQTIVSNTKLHRGDNLAVLHTHKLFDHTDVLRATLFDGLIGKVVHK